MLSLHLVTLLSSPSYQRMETLRALSMKLIRNFMHNSIHTITHSLIQSSLQPLDPELPRQLQSDTSKLPQRKRVIAGRTSKAPRSATTVIASIWKTVYGPITIDPTATFEGSGICLMSTEHDSDFRMDQNTFAHINALCLKATTLSKSARAQNPLDRLLRRTH